MIDTKVFLGTIIFAAGLYFLFQFSRKVSHYKTLQIVLLMGFVIRIVALLATMRMNMLYSSLDDISTYDRISWWLAEQWQNGSMPSLKDVWTVASPGYYYIVAIIYYFLGHHMLWAQLFNIWLSLLTGIGIYVIGEKWFSSQIGHWAAGIFLLFPSIILWSVLELKDIVVIALVVGAILLFQKMEDRLLFRYLVALILLLLVLAMNRYYMYSLIAFHGLILLLRGLRTSSWDWQRVTAIVSLVIFMIALSNFGQGPVYVRLFSDQGLSRVRNLLSMGGSSVAGNVLQRKTAVTAKGSSTAAGSSSGGAVVADKKGVSASGVSILNRPNEIEGVSYGRGKISSPGSLLTFMLRNSVYFLLGPFPWQSGSRLLQISKLEMVVWYPVFILSIVGLVAALMKRNQYVWIPIGYSLALIGLYSFLVGNLGTLVRYRAQLIPFAAVLACYGAQVIIGRVGFSKETFPMKGNVL